jgi:hypothetical protein
VSPGNAARERETGKVKSEKVEVVWKGGGEFNWRGELAEREK